MTRGRAWALLGTILCSSLTACGRTSEPPIVAVETQAGATVISGDLRKTFKNSSVHAISGDGRFVVDKSVKDTLVFQVGTVGKSITVKPFHPFSDNVYPDFAFGSDGLIGLGQLEAGARLAVFDRQLKQTRSIRLPGQNSGAPGLAEASDTYWSPTQVADPILVSHAHWKDVAATADSVVRIDPDNSIHVLLKNRHVNGLTAASDGKSLLATIDKEAPYYEGSPANSSIIELDPSTGKIVKSYGLPPTCRHFRGMIESASCVSAVDKVNGAVAAEIYESVRGKEPFEAILTTWVVKDGAWKEVASQHGKKVRWLGGDTRIEEVTQPDISIGYNDVFLVDGGKRTRLGKKGDWTGWQSRGSLIQP